MFKQLLSLLHTDTNRDTFIVFLGTLINVMAGGLFFIFVPRLLGPADYGLFSVVISTCLMGAAIANFGLDTGILRFAKKDSAILGLAFKFYLALGAATAILGFLTAPFTAVFLGYPQIINLLRLGFVGIIFILLSNFFVAALQINRQFTKASVVGISSNIARLLILGIAYYFFKVNLYFLTSLFFFVVIISVVLGKLYQPVNFGKTTVSIKEFFKYNSWIALALIISSIPFDNFVLLKMAGAAATGLYAAPFKVLTFVYQFGGNFTRVLASRYAGFDTNKKAIEFSVKSSVFPVMFSLGLLVLILLSHFVIRLLFGLTYEGSAVVMQILALGFIFFFVSTIPSSLIIYYFGRPNISFYVTAIHYLSFLILLIVLVPKQQAVGGAWAFTLSELVSLVSMSIYVLSRLKKDES